MHKEQVEYQSYLLRLRRVNGADKEPARRASVQSSLNGRQKSSANLLDLLGFLLRQTGVGADAEDNDG